MGEPERERRTAKREYLYAGAVAMIGAAVAIAADVTDRDGSGFGPGLIVVAALAALAYGRIAYQLLRGADDGEGGPGVDRLRKMAAIWLLLAVVLAVGLLRRPFAAWREAGIAALAPRDWLLAGAGLAVLAAVVARGIAAFVSGRRRAGIT